MPGTVLLYVFGWRAPFDVRVSEFVLPDQVVIYESLIVGAGVIGFLCAPFCIIAAPVLSI